MYICKSQVQEDSESTFDIDKELADVTKRVRETSGVPVSTPVGKSPELKRLRQVSPQVMADVSGNAGPAVGRTSHAQEQALQGLPSEPLAAPKIPPQNQQAMQVPTQEPQATCADPEMPPQNQQAMQGPPKPSATSAAPEIPPQNQQAMQGPPQEPKPATSVAIEAPPQNQQAMQLETPAKSRSKEDAAPKDLAAPSKPPSPEKLVVPSPRNLLPALEKATTADPAMVS